ncbi:MAG: amino acid ABC transporter permease [Actinobacteria bacterium]|nr:amino acid ABC transporter permease [Actinomycetota bacterium]
MSAAGEPRTEATVEQLVSAGADLRVKRARHPGRWLGALLIAVLVAVLVRSVVTNENFQWDVVGEYIFDEGILSGLVTTLWLTVVAMLIGIVLSVILAVMRLSPNPLVSGASGFYLWFFRGTPVLVQLIFWYNLAALFPTISLGIPFGPSFIHGSSNAIITPYVAAILGLGLNEAAYMAEIVRAGILSVDKGQDDAARALGMKRSRAMRRVILPQAMRFIIPPTGNETIGMLKTTSLVSVIALSDLLYSAQAIYSRNYETIPLLIVVSIWYLFLTSLLTIGQRQIEAYFGRGHRGQAKGGRRGRRLPWSTTAGADQGAAR